MPKPLQEPYQLPDWPGDRSIRSLKPQSERKDFHQLTNLLDSQEDHHRPEALLFVYGSLRPGFAGEMAALLADAARHLGPAAAQGALFRVDDYPAFVPGAGGTVMGDLFLMHEPDSLLAILDDYEQCTAAYPHPHEYRRERLTVQAAWGPAEAWTYAYAWDTTGLEPISGGDFLAPPA